MKNIHSALGYITELDGIRGAAVGAVMLLHARAPYSQGGFIGVDVFFVMSGFLITSLLLREHTNNGFIDLRHFYVRRLLRLTPALLLFLGVVVLISITLLDSEQAQQNITSAFVSVTYVSNWVRAFHLHQMQYLGHTWSLAIEEQFYLLWPLLLTVMLRFTNSFRSIIYITLFISLLSWLLRAYLMWHGSTIQRVYYGFDTRVDGLLVGCILGILLFAGYLNREPSSRYKWIPIAVSVFSAGGLLLFFVLANAYEPYMYYWGFVVVDILAAGLIYGVVVAKSGPLNALLRVKPLVWLGSISYGVYLWHLPIFFALRSLGYSRMEVLAIGVPITLAVAALSFYFWERPFLRLKDRFGTGASFKRAVKSFS